jgi:NitT/TauT family transport system ATP-binding protein
VQEELLKMWLQFKTTVVFVTYDIDEAIFLSDRVLVMRTLPGGLKTSVDIDLPRPRSWDLVRSSMFNTYRGHVLELIREETLKVFETRRKTSP